MISIDEVRSNPDQWTDTSYLRFDGKTEYRENKKYGNRHAVFDNGQFWGTVHTDQHNATDVPFGTVRHFSKYVEEKTSVPQILTEGIIAGFALYAGYKTTKWAYDNIKDSD